MKSCISFDGAGAAALARPISALMSSPVEALPPDAFVYAAIGRMDRLGLRHLAVVDPASGRLLGVVSARALLRLRAGQTPALGDEIVAARTGADLAAIHGRLPDLAGALRREKVPALDIAGVIGAVLRDLSGCAARLAAAAMARDGHGAAPAAWCYLVLGSGGRGESLLAADQDNALVHTGAADDDPWFAELGKRASDLLDAAGVPYCRAKVMAMDPAWRHNLAGWRRRIDGWVGARDGESLLSVDIFYDFAPVEGDRGLAEALRAHAMAVARSSPMFLALLAQELKDMGAPIGLFGRFATENGRVDLKAGGLLPLVSGARVLALKRGVAATATAARLQAAAEAGLLNDADLATLGEAHELLAGLVLDQQIADIAAGLAPSTRVEVKRLTGVERRRLRAALKSVNIIDYMVGAALSG